MEREHNSRPRRYVRSLRAQLLLAVNASLAVIVAGVLLHDYRRGFAERVEEKRVALQEEAKVLAAGVPRLIGGGLSAVQEYINDVCGEMQETDSPGHHIAVTWRGDVLQAVAHHRASPEILDAMRWAANTATGRAPLGETELVVGASHRAGLTVYVSESLADLHRSVRADLVRRLVELLVMAVAGGIAVNLVLWRMVAAPISRLVITVRRIAAGQREVETGRFGCAELDYLAGEIDAMSHALAAADRDRRLQMTKAREIQEHLQSPPVQTPGVRAARLFRPAEEVAGDYCDILQLPGGATLLCVADVTGHGVPAAMNAAMLKMLLLQAIEQSSCPGEILSFINQRYCEVSLTGDFVTMLLVRTDGSGGCLQYASAGHEPAWLRSPEGELRELPATGPLLGVMPAAGWTVGKVRVRCGTRLLMYTDGIPETFGPDGNCLGRQRTADLLTQTCDLEPPQAVARIEHLLHDFRGGKPNQDDATLLVVDLAGSECPSDAGQECRLKEVVGDAWAPAVSRTGGGSRSSRESSPCEESRSSA